MKKDRQQNGQRKIDKKTNNHLQNTTEKTKDRATLIQLNTGGELRYSGRVSSSCSTCSTNRVTLLTAENGVSTMLEFGIGNISVKFERHIYQQLVLDIKHYL